MERVLRQVVLRKAPSREPEVHDVLTAASGEIDRQLEGTKIGARPPTPTSLVADYPLLPVRRRFWERVLRAIDRAGSAGQLRTQLRTVHDSTKQVADEPLGTVVPADTIYGQQLQSMLQSGVLLREVFETIRELDDGTEEGRLRSRLCSLVFLISQLPTDAAPTPDSGLPPRTSPTSLVRDLNDGQRRRCARPCHQHLDHLVERGVLLKLAGPIGDEFRLQTRESSEWEAAYRTALAAAANDAARIGSERNRELREAVNDELKISHCCTAPARHLVALSFRSARTDPPPIPTIPVWIRDEWNVREKTVIEEAQAAGAQDPTVYVFLPKRSADALKTAISGYLAAEEVLQTRGTRQLATAEGIEAKRSMEARRDRPPGRHRRHTERGGQERARLPGRRQRGGRGAPARRCAGRGRTRRHPQVPRIRPRRPPRLETCRRPRTRGQHRPPRRRWTHQRDEGPRRLREDPRLRGGGGKKGSDVRKAFEAPPYGWPREAIDGILLSLMNADLVGATLNGATTPSKVLDASKIGLATFKSQSVVLTAPQRIRYPRRHERSRRPCQVRRGEPSRRQASLPPSRSSRALPAATHQHQRRQRRRTLTTSATAAETSSSSRSTVKRDKLTDDIRTWRADQGKLEARLPRWRIAQRLLDHARSLAIADEIAPQLDAIREQRALLRDPDPLPPIIHALVSTLREELAARYKHLIHTFAHQTKDLADSPSLERTPRRARPPTSSPATSSLNPRRLNSAPRTTSSMH